MSATIKFNGETLPGVCASGWSVSGSGGISIASRKVLDAVKFDGAAPVQCPQADFSITTTVYSTDDWEKIAAYVAGLALRYVNTQGALVINNTTIATKAACIGVSANSGDAVVKQTYTINWSFTILESPQGSNGMINYKDLENGGFEIVGSLGQAYGVSLSSGNAELVQRYGTELIGSGDRLARFKYDSGSGFVKMPAQALVNSTLQGVIRYEWDVAFEKHDALQQAIGKYRATIVGGTIPHGSGTACATYTFELRNNEAYRHGIEVNAPNGIATAYPYLWLEFSGVDNAASNGKWIYIDNVTCTQRMK